MDDWPRAVLARGVQVPQPYPDPYGPPRNVSHTVVPGKIEITDDTDKRRIGHLRKLLVLVLDPLEYMVRQHKDKLTKEELDAIDAIRMELE